ncbi:MAG TPA: type VI secretion system contractile sheath large subunit [Terriglobia bacterium]|nr:type VI secretion system contractile sheath large subunit [Terriglobia bacterium]
MSIPFSFGEINIDVAPGSERARATPEPNSPFHIAILGDFSGRANRGIVDDSARIATRQPVMVDRDNFDEVLAGLGAELNLPARVDGGPSTAIHFSELDDFHPDWLYKRLDVFRHLKELRQRLSDPSTFAAAAAEMGVEISPKSRAEPAELTPARPTQAPDVSQLLSGSLLDELIEQTEERSSRGSDEWSDFLRRLVAPHLVPGEHPRQAELMAQVDKATSREMQALLHHPEFQALEAAWRAVFFLVKRVETDTNLKLYLIDISKAELAADLASKGDLRETGIYRLLVERTVGTPGAPLWSVLAGNYTFDLTRGDAGLLARLAAIAQAAGAPFLAAAHPRLLGCESIADVVHPRTWRRNEDTEDARAWRALRGLPQAAFAGLALPRFLLRLPYGKKTESTEEFDFEEMPQVAEHECLLWGNPAFACVLLLAEAFAEYQWEMRPGVCQDIEGLPLFVYEKDGESFVKPCAEVLLTQQAAERILEEGLMPLVWFKDQDMVRVARFQSIADPLKNLSGHWG